VQANCIWLISGTTVTLIFSKSQCPEWDQPQRLAKNWMRKVCLEIAQFFLMKPQVGLGCPSAPLRRGPGGLEFWLQGTMLKVLLQHQPNTCHLRCRGCQLLLSHSWMGQVNKEHGEKKLSGEKTPGGRCCFSFPMRTLGLKPCISMGRCSSSK
jgi:hypothetical protein